MDLIRRGLYAIVEEGRPMTVRQVFYQAVTRGFIEKTEAEYKTVGRLLTELRLASVANGDDIDDGARESVLATLIGRGRGSHGELERSMQIGSEYCRLRDLGIGHEEAIEKARLPTALPIPFSWIADNTRWMRKPTTWSSVDAALKRTAETYRRQLWDNQDSYVEVWLEKEALAGVIVEVTSEWDVPLMVTRGYPSLSFVHSAAAAMAGVDKPIFIYYLGDRDPSGVDIPRNVEMRLSEFTPDADIEFEVIAVTPEQIDALGLPTRPTKKTDSRSRSFAGESVEVDAIPPTTLRQLVEDVIEQHVDHHQLRVLREAENSERELLLEMAGMK